MYGLTLASGHIRAGLVTHADLAALHEETGVAVFLGVQAGDHLITSPKLEAIPSRDSRRGRTSAADAGHGGGRRCSRRSQTASVSRICRHSAEADLVDSSSRSTRRSKGPGSRRTFAGGTRFGIATTVHNQSGEAVAAITLVGLTAEVRPRVQELAERLLRHVDSWQQRSMTPREAI